MSYERPDYQKRPAKFRKTGRGGRNNNRTRGVALTSSIPVVTVPYSAVLFSKNGGYTGAASVGILEEKTGRAAYIGWLKILRDIGCWRNWIVPIERMTKKTRKVTEGEPHVAVQQNGVVVREDREFGDTFRHDLNLLVARTYAGIKSSGLREQTVTPELLDQLRTRFPEEYLTKAKKGKKIICLESRIVLSRQYTMPL